MIVALMGERQFGQDGPQPGDIGEAFTFIIDEIGDVLFATKFEGHRGFFWVPADRATGTITRVGTFPYGT